MRKILNKLNIGNRRGSGQRRDRAQGMVEFALVLPILLLLVLGIIEFGRLLFMYASVTSASREGARYGAAAGYFGGVLRYKDCNGIIDAATRIGGIAGVGAGDVAIEYTLYNDDGSTTTLTGCPPSSPVNLADRIVVTVLRNFQPIVPLVNIPAIPISSTTARTIVKSVYVQGTPGPTPTDNPMHGFNTWTPSPTPTDTPTPTPTDESTPTPSPTASDTATPSDTPSATPTPTPGPSLTPTDTATPTATPTEDFTPTPTPIPVCDPAVYKIKKSLTREIDDSLTFYSVYLTIQNISPSPLVITQIDFDWPGWLGQSITPLKEIWFDTGTVPGQSCSDVTCIWDGWNGTEDFWSVSVCESGCTEMFDGTLGDRTLQSSGNPGELKDLRFVFGDDLNTSSHPSYNPNPYPYLVRIVFDNSCYIETLKTQYYHP